MSKTQFLTAYHTLKPAIEKMEKYLLEGVQQGPEAVRDAAHYITKAGGKRLRPALLLTCANLLRVDAQTAIPMAAMLEWVHMATLIHDDAIDQADFRRGKPALHKYMGHNIAILIGDFFYARAVQEAVKTQELKIIQLIAQVTVKMIEGEIMALERLCDPTLKKEDYLEIVMRKTAYLFGAACQIPAFLGDDGSFASPLFSYGINFGVAFQIMDDVKDFEKTEKDRGKPVLQDLKEGKITLPVILLLSSLNGSEREKLETLVKKAPENRYEIHRWVLETDSLSATREVAKGFAEKAVDAIKNLPESKEKELLRTAPFLIL